MDQVRAAGISAFGARETGVDSVSGVVSGFAAAVGDEFGIQQEGLTADDIARSRADAGLRGADHCAAGPGNECGDCVDHGGHSFCGGALVEMAGCGSGDCVAAVAGADHWSVVPAGTAYGVSASSERSAGCGVSVAAVADCGGLGRIHRRWADGEQTETVLFAGSTHGFYLCGDLRRAGIYRRGDCDCVVRSVWMARAAGFV